MTRDDRDRPAHHRAVTSLQNPTVKAVRALDMRKVRRETGLFVAEGASVLVTAREHGWRPKTLLHQAGAADGGIHRELVAWAAGSGAEILEVSEAVLGKVASKDNPQSMLAVFQQAWQPPPDACGVPPEAVWIGLEEVRDPGNLGTIIRTADAVGAAGVMLIGTCCDPYSREAVRASMGSTFAVPLVRTGREAFLQWRRSWPGEVVGTHLAAAEDFRAVTYRGPTLLAMGSEGPGLSEDLAAACDRLVKVPMAGRLDSLNLAVATALMLYQIRGPHLRL
ncbi:MAG: RNA methyltransferase [Hyphomicrobiaceae bacterium]|nr:RNA methyltransferase [Hyphomicrobiaceae bacterium]